MTTDLATKPLILHIKQPGLTLVDKAMYLW